MQLERPDPSLGVFETLLVSDRRVQAPEAHLDRLRRSVTELYGLELPTGLLCATVEQARALSEPHRLRIDAIPEDGQLLVKFTTKPVGDAATNAVVCAPVKLPGGLGGHKWRDRRLLDSLAGPGLVPLLVDRDGGVLEASLANVWLLEQGRLITPPADGRLLPGVTRALLVALGSLSGLDVRVEPVSLPRARAAAQIFLTSSVRHAVAATLQPVAGDGAQTPPTAHGDDACAGAGERAPSTLARIRDLLSAGSWT
jgi:para-aminobenzoate synthetase / 4-amino-4-deoxychorismate lyase